MLGLSLAVLLAARGHRGLPVLAAQREVGVWSEYRGGRPAFSGGSLHHRRPCDPSFAVERAGARRPASRPCGGRAGGSLPL